MKQPVGIEPKFVWLERRREELYAVIERYRNATRAPDVKWLEELTEVERTITACKCYECGKETPPDTVFPGRVRSMAPPFNFWNAPVVAGAAICDQCVAERMVAKLERLAQPWYRRAFRWLADRIGW